MSDRETGTGAPVKLLIEQPVNGESGQVLLRSKLRAVSRRMGFSAVARERMELVCNEMVTNQIKFARAAGMVQIWEVARPSHAIDLFALDFGLGIANLPAALEDGYTTAGTMGKGLGAIRRLANESEFYTVPSGVATAAPWHGTAVWARFYVKPCEPGSYQVGQYLRAYQDDVHNGDSICMEDGDGRLRWLHMDGLGHGMQAEQVVKGREDILGIDAPLAEVMQVLSGRLKGTRGAVGMLADVDAATVRICGVGDMAAYLILNGERKNVLFAPGVLGHEHRSFDETELQFPSQAMLVTGSDGLRRNWNLGSFPGLWRLHPQLVALLLGQIMGRGNDDKSIFVLRRSSSKGGH
ncbi:MAG: SpoIIE family protein phosphatase [Gammaproteobacteria bacterium]